VEPQPGGNRLVVDRAAGWLRLKALPAEKPALARDTVTQKLWDTPVRST